jgi:hypothetical protein
MAFMTRIGLLRLMSKFAGRRSFGPEIDGDDARRARRATLRTSMFVEAADEMRSIRDASSEERHSSIPGSLGDRPVAVITHGVKFPGGFAPLEDGWAESQERLAALSSNSLRVTIEKAGHQVQTDAPDVVVEIIRRAHQATRDHARIASDGWPQLSSPLWVLAS